MNKRMLALIALIASALSFEIGAREVTCIVTDSFRKPVLAVLNANGSYTYVPKDTKNASLKEAAGKVTFVHSATFVPTCQCNDTSYIKPGEMTRAIYNLCQKGDGRGHKFNANNMEGP